MGWVGVGLGVLATIRQSNQDKGDLERQRRFAGYEADYNDAVAKVTKQQLALQYQKIIGRGNTANAASGFDASSKSSRKAIYDILLQAELDAASIDVGSQLNRFKSDFEQAGYGRAIDNVRTAGYFKAASQVANYALS